ncbi:hypothetical protein ACHHYP_01416 [Achlya hypogyna]|uniref:DnaJ homologue subfamily C GRV2/DNAJC13 N-terminal domain-containing protein n=1 Tax=Achlya hypogyna TaxID=1202772 RepID=A0A1V9Z8L7_ACHHY|nr:hypothetical protein ACHHYP_01416 [Achlya hypogyna]
MADSPSSTHRSMSSSTLRAEQSSAEDFIARFLTTKLSWKGKYERIFALSSTRFCTLDPKDFDLTNTWSYAAFVSLDLDATDDQVFTITFMGLKKEEQLKLRYKYRSYLVSEFLRLHAAFASGSPVPVPTTAPSNVRVNATKLTRHDTEIACVLEVAVDAILFTTPAANTPNRTNVALGRYAYTDIDHVTVLANSTTGVVLGYGGKDKIFFTTDRRLFLSNVEKAAARVGLRLASRGSLTVDGVKDARRRGLDDCGECMGEFPVQKYSPRYEMPVKRVLRIYTKYVVEVDAGSRAVVSRTPLKLLFGLVRTAQSKSRFELEFVNGQRRLYAGRDRDALLASLYDAHAVGTADSTEVLSIAPVASHSGLRLLPRFATEDPTEMRTFFGDASIGSMFLKRIAAVGKYTAGTGHRAGVAAGRGLVAIACEFNANVPLTGIQYHTKRSIIADALKPLSFQLRTVATVSPPAPKMAVALLQCFCRIATSYYGFLDILSLPHVVDNLVLFLSADDALTVFWATLLIQRLTVHRGAGAAAVGDDGDPMARGSSGDAEAVNKRVLWSHDKLVLALLGQLGSRPLANLGVLQTLEPALCSRRATTDAKDVARLVEGLVPYYDVLIRLLFRSHCAATVEACTLLVQTVLQLCAPEVASGIKDAALREGLVLQHLYQAVFDVSFDQRVVSRYLIAMWMSHHPPAKKLLKRILPPGLVSCLEMRLLSPPEVYQLDELEKATFEHQKLSFFDADLSPRRDGSFATDDDDDSFVASMRRPHDDALFEDDVADTIILPSSAPQSFTASRSEASTLFPSMRSEGSRSSVPDVALPRLVGKIHSEPPKGAQNVFQDPVRRAPPPKAEGLAVHLTLLKRAFASRPPSLPDVAPPVAGENFRVLFHMLQQDHNAIDLLWTAETRDELRRALATEILHLREYQASVARAVWNYEEFSVAYPSVEAALVVDGLQLARILAVADESATDEDTWSPPVHTEELLLKQPKRFVNALYKRFLKELPYAEFRGETATTVALLRVLARVAWLYENDYQLCADDVRHLLRLLVETRRKDVLTHGLRALRAITKCPRNAAKLLGAPRAIPWLLQLVQMAHVAQRGPPTPAWCLHVGAAVIGPITVAAIADEAAARQWPVADCQLHALSEPCVAAQPLDAIPQLRWELGLDTSMAPAAVAVAHDALHVLCDLLHANPLVLSHAHVFPPPTATLQAHTDLGALVPVLALTERPALAEVVAHVLVTVFASAAVVADDVYLSGVYYLLFGYSGEAFEDFARFLQLTHARQMRPTGGPRAILADLLPPAMVRHVDTLSPQQFQALFCATDVATPRVVWNAAMRATLRGACIAHMAAFKATLSHTVAARYVYEPMAPVAYGSLDDDLYVHGFHLRQFCRAIDAGEAVPLDDPAAFLRQLRCTWTAEDARVGASMTQDEAADVLGITSPAASLAAVRAAFTAKATGLCPEHALDDRGQYDEVVEAFTVLTAPRPSLLSPGYDGLWLQLLLDTQLRVCATYVAELRHAYTFEAYPQLLAFLETHCTTAGLCVPALTPPAMHLELVQAAAALLAETVSVSPLNGPALLADPQRAVLDAALTHCVDHLCGPEPDEAYEVVAGYLVQTVAALAASVDGRAWVAASGTVLPDLWRVLWRHHRDRDCVSGHGLRLVRQTLAALALLCESHELQARLVAETGVLWHLVQLLFAYDARLDVATTQVVLQTSVLFDARAPGTSLDQLRSEAANVLADSALGIVARLTGAAGDNPGEATAAAIVANWFTPNLVAHLRQHKNRHEFLKLFHSDTTAPWLVWTPTLRDELQTHLQPGLTALSSPDVSAARAFRFAGLATHCLVAHVYLSPLAAAVANPANAPSVDLVRGLGLPEGFYVALLEFIAAGDRELPTYCGWELDGDGVLAYRGTALGILASLAQVAPSAVEAGVLQAPRGLATLASFVLPPDNKLWADDRFVRSHVAVPDAAFTGFRASILRVLCAVAGSRAVGDALFEAGLLDVLLHAMLLEDDASAALLRVLGQLCGASPTIARYVVDSVWIYHVLLWIFPDAASVTDAGHDFGPTMQVPAAEILSALAAETSVVSEATLNVFIRFVPVSLVYEIVGSPAQVETIFKGKYESPDLVWNNAMRAHLYRGLRGLTIQVHQCTDDGAVSEALESAEIDYAEVYPYPVVGDVYILLYLENPIYPLRDPKFFLECLVEDFDKIVTALLSIVGDTNRTSFNPDLIMLRRQQAQVLPLLTSCIVCVARVFPVLLEQLVVWKTHEKACTLLVQLQSHHKESRDEEVIVCETSLLRLFRVLFTSPKVVAALAYSPFDVLSRLFAHCYLRRQGEYHAETGFILESVRRFLFLFPDNGDRNSDRNVVAVVCTFNLLESLLELIEHPTTLQRVVNPLLTRATIIAILNQLEAHRTQGGIAHNILKKNKKWDKVYRHEPTDAVRTQPEDKFLTGPAGNADGMIRQYLATKAQHASPPAPSMTTAQPPTSFRKKLNVKGLFGH